jgi:HSP20 family protein
MEDTTMAEKKESSRESGVVRWDPFRELREWHPLREMGLFMPRFDRLFGELEDTWGPGRGVWGPAMDVAETDAHYTVTVELPGAKREDVTVEVEDGVLTIRGEKKSEREEKKEHRRWVERRFGTFSRSFTLPANADAERVEATFEAGVLTLRIAKSEAAKPKTIAIK